MREAVRTLFPHQVCASVAEIIQAALADCDATGSPRPSRAEINDVLRTFGYSLTLRDLAREARERGE